MLAQFRRHARVEVGSQYQSVSPRGGISISRAAVIASTKHRIVNLDWRWRRPGLIDYPKPAAISPYIVASAYCIFIICRNDFTRRAATPHLYGLRLGMRDRHNDSREHKGSRGTAASAYSLAPMFAAVPRPSQSGKADGIRQKRPSAEIYLAYLRRLPPRHNRCPTVEQPYHAINHSAQSRQWYTDSRQSHHPYSNRHNPGQKQSGQYIGRQKMQRQRVEIIRRLQSCAEHGYHWQHSQIGQKIAYRFAPKRVGHNLREGQQRCHGRKGQLQTRREQIPGPHGQYCAQRQEQGVGWPRSALQQARQHIGAEHHCRSDHRGRHPSQHCKSPHRQYRNP